MVEMLVGNVDRVSFWIIVKMERYHSLYKPLVRFVIDPLTRVLCTAALDMGVRSNLYEIITGRLDETDDLAIRK